MSDEIGRPLRADELKRGEIVVISPPGRTGTFITMWVEEVRTNLVVFYAGEVNQHIINLIDNEGDIIDDQGRIVRVFEYLGEP